MKAVKLLAALSIVAGLVYYGLTLYVQHRTQRSVDQAIAAMRPFVEISYSGVTTTMRGSVGLKSVEIAIAGFQDAVRIASLTLETPSFAFLLDMDRRMRSGDVPESLAVNLGGLQIGLEDDYLLAAEQKLMTMPDFAAMMTATGCAETSRYGSADYRRLGYQRLLIDLRMGYRLSDGVMAVFVDGGVEDVSSFQMSVDLDAAKLPATPAAVAGFRPKLRRARLLISDDSLFARVEAYCIESGQMADSAEVVEAHVQDFFNSMSDSGIMPDEPILSAYRSYASQPGSFEMTAEPLNPVDLNHIKLYKQADVPNLLNLNARAY